MHSLDITRLLGHPERLNRDTLYSLRTIVASYPYFQTARILLLTNMYLLQEPDFGRELRKSVLYVSDRRTLWRLVEGMSTTKGEWKTENGDLAGAERTITEHEFHESTRTNPPVDRTLALIDAFLGAPADKQPALVIDSPVSTDYMAMLEGRPTLEAPQRPTLTLPQREETQVPLSDEGSSNASQIVLPMREDLGGSSGEDLGGSAPDNDAVSPEFFTETLARIYIKQKKYDRALEIIRSLYLNYPEKSIYFADQIRFLEKLVRNNNSKKIN